MHQHPGRFALQAQTFKEHLMTQFIVKSVKPRNPLVAPSLRRAAGAHGRRRGGCRHRSQAALQRELRDLQDQRQSP